MPGLETFNCQKMVVPTEVMQHVVRVESSYNPFAIGVVGGHLVRQPKNLPEALATVRMLEDKGYNFSLGLAQVNRYNLAKYGLDSYEKAFDACPNLEAGSKILAECYKRLGGDWGKSFSCYYSGNSVTGFRHGYVQKIYSSMRLDPKLNPVASSAPIQVVGKSSRKQMNITRHPVYNTTQLISRRTEVSAPMIQQSPIVSRRAEVSYPVSQASLPVASPSVVSRTAEMSYPVSQASLPVASGSSPVVLQPAGAAPIQAVQPQAVVAQVSAGSNAAAPLAAEARPAGSSASPQAAPVGDRAFVF